MDLDAPGAHRAWRSRSPRALTARDPASRARPTCRSRCSRRCCSSPPSARSSRFPVLTLRMLDLFPAARGTAASAQSFVALLITAFTLGIVSPQGAAAPGVDRLDVAGSTVAAPGPAGTWRGAGTKRTFPPVTLRRDRARTRPPAARRHHHRDRARSSARSLAGVRPVTRRSSRVACAWSAKPLSPASSEMLASPSSSARSVACRRISRANLSA